MTSNKSACEEFALIIIAIVVDDHTSVTAVLVTIICFENGIFFDAKLTLKFRVPEQLIPKCFSSLRN